MQIDEIATNVTQNCADIEILDDRIVEQQTTNAEQQVEINALFSNFTEQNVEIFELEGRVTSLEEDIADGPGNSCESSPCMNGATCVDVNVDTFICVCRDGFFGITCENTCSYSSAGFMAYLTFDIESRNGVGIPFDNVVYDTGNNYNHSSGVYKVPYAGYYLIHTRVFGRDHAAQHFILVDGDDTIYTEEYDLDTANQSGSTTTVLHLSQGQEVVVWPNFTGTIAGTIHYRITWFGAQLLYPL